MAATLSTIDHADRGAFEFVPETATDATDLHPEAHALGPMSPNPMAGRGRFAFVVPSRGPVRVSVVDIQGRTVATLVDRVCEPGRYESSWDGTAVRGPAGAGLYFLRLEAPGVRVGRRFVLQR